MDASGDAAGEGWPGREQASGSGQGWPGRGQRRLPRSPHDGRTEEKAEAHRGARPRLRLYAPHPCSVPPSVLANAGTSFLCPAYPCIRPCLCTAMSLSTSVITDAHITPSSTSLGSIVTYPRHCDCYHSDVPSVLSPVYHGSKYSTDSLVRMAMGDEDRALYTTALMYNAFAGIYHAMTSTRHRSSLAYFDCGT